MYFEFWDMLSSMLIIWIIPLILIVIIGISIYMIVKNKRGKSPALEILNERFAKGEINEEEYIKKKENLSG